MIRAALDLLNEVGVDGLTTRKLAERLGFSSRRFTGTSGTSGRCSMHWP
ncbi:TetR family transcriptional regulator [Escherichia coli]